MNRLHWFLFLLIGLVPASSFGQTATDSLSPANPDSILVKDSVVRDTVTLSAKRPIVLVREWTLDTGKPLAWQIMEQQPFFAFGKTALIKPASSIRQFKGKEGLFYVLVGMVIFFALLKIAFGKYLGDLWRLFFRTTMKGRQIRDQMTQSPLPSLLFNIFFILISGLYTVLLLQYLKLELPITSFWLLVSYACLGIAIVYTVKYLGLLVMGWLFNLKALTDTYVFIVFMINKVLGVALLPLAILVAFTKGDINTVCWMFSWLVIGLLFLYRYVLAAAAVRNHVRINIFHFFLYIAAFEIAPLLIIYKILLFLIR